MIIVVGDIHGQWDKFMKKIKALDLKDCFIIQAGDFGIGFERKTKELAKLSFMNEFLQKRRICLYAFRGNHDDPSFFDGTFNYSNIKLSTDYSVLHLCNKKILLVGGAISLDRKKNPDIVDFRGKMWKGRKEGSTYWREEAFALNEKLAETFTNIDYVITHSAPNFCEPHTKGGITKWAKHDTSLIEEVAKERNDHAKLFDILEKNKCPLKKWYYGHFHDSYRTEFNGVDFIGLDIDEFVEIR